MSLMNDIAQFKAARPTAVSDLSITECIAVHDSRGRLRFRMAARDFRTFDYIDKISSVPLMVEMLKIGWPGRLHRYVEYMQFWLNFN